MAASLGMNYFHKELVANKLNLPNGRKVVFETLGDGNGVIATNDNYIVREFRVAISQHTHGVSEISSEQYEELKKNATATPSQHRQAGQRSALSAQSLIDRPGRHAAAAVVRATPVEAVSQPMAEPAPTQPIKVQKEFSRPVTKKLFKDN